LLIGAVPLAHAGDRDTDHGAFLGAHCRIPDVEDHDCARLVAVVPGFVLDRIVEHKRLARFPFPRFAADAETAARRMLRKFPLRLVREPGCFVGAASRTRAVRCIDQRVEALIVPHRCIHLVT
jgi:hypothetical protein